MKVELVERNVYQVNVRKNKYVVVTAKNEKEAIKKANKRKF